MTSTWALFDKFSLNLAILGILYPGMCSSHRRRLAVLHRGCPYEEEEEEKKKCFACANNQGNLESVVFIKNKTIYW